MAPFPYKSPLEGYENLPPLDSEARNPDGKSLVNPPTGKLSHAYEDFPEPIISTNNGFDFHSESSLALLQTKSFTYTMPVYYMQSVPEEAEYAKALHERIRREFPEVRIDESETQCLRPEASSLAAHLQAMGQTNWTTPRSHV